ncbi:MAG: formate dehydrogenase, partial [Verrucomicrobiae bacterium]|nr:formate dehydrogenase [Verrucomicrobiae bacterium]
MVEAAEARGTAETKETVAALSEEYLVGEAIALGAVSAYDFLKAENAGKKVFVCDGSACLVAGTQEGLHEELTKYFAEEEIGHICCLGRCHQGGAYQHAGANFSGKESGDLAAQFERGEADSSDIYRVASTLPEPILTAEFPGIDAFYEPFRKLLAGGDRGALFAELKESKLRGRGGAGFPLSFKWQSCREAEGSPKYIVCNADEG